MQCATGRCSETMNFVLEYQKKNKDEYLLIDNDMFLINHFDITKYRQYDATFILQNRGDIYYMWPQFYYFNMNKMQGIELLNWNVCDGCDCGGMSKNWLKNEFPMDSFPNLEDIRYSENGFEIKKCLAMKHLWSLSWDRSELPIVPDYDELLKFLETDPRNINGKFFCEIYDNVFLHYRAGTNWKQEGMFLHKYLVNKLKNILIHKE